MLKNSEETLQSLTLSEKDAQYIWHPFTPLQGAVTPVIISSAKGCWLYTAEDRAVLDAISSWWVNIHGHSHPYIAEKIAAQAKTLEHVIFAGFSHPPAIHLAERLLKVLPENQDKIFYSDNGSTAVEVAIKMAFQYWYNKGEQRKKIIAIEGAYHGDTFGAMAVGDRGAFTAPFHSFLFDVDFIPFPTGDNDEAILNRFSELLATEDVAAFIFEPLLQGSAGMRTYEAPLLNKLIKLAQKHQTLCIADEVMTGFYRTGKFFATDYVEASPDIFCLSKGLTGGTMALGVTSCSAAVVEAYDAAEWTKTFFHGHSFTANPIACTTALASLDLLQEESCLQNIRFIEQRHQRFADELRQNNKIKSVRNLGTMLAFELKNEESTTYFNKARNSIYSYFMDQNILLRPLGNVIYILPPYVINEEELSTIYEAIHNFIKAV